MSGLFPDDISVKPIVYSETKRVATFSPCQNYRYTLRIVWDESLPVAAFIGLNPSTATDEISDPTVTRCIAFAQREGCGGMTMLNLFAFRATDPKVMKAQANPVGDENYLPEFLKQCNGPHIACWGTHGIHMGQGRFITAALDNLVCFGRNRDGSPKHPLYLRADTKLEPLTKKR